MGPRDVVPSEVKPASVNAEKRRYVAPKLERLGTIVELTRGLGNNNQFDGGHPPGQNKSIL
jgi:hypothetical protein